MCVYIYMYIYIYIYIYTHEVDRCRTQSAAEQKGDRGTGAPAQWGDPTQIEDQQRAATIRQIGPSQRCACGGATRVCYRFVGCRAARLGRILCEERRAFDFSEAARG